MTLALPALPSPPHPSRLGLLAGVTAVALLAVFLLPFRAASVWPGGGYADVASLTAAVEHGLVAWWSAGGESAGSVLADPVAFWARFHAVKALLSALLLVAAVQLGVGLWRAHGRATGRARRAGLALTALAEAPVALLALLLVVANVQGAIAPLSSAVSLVPVGASDPRLAATLGGMRHELEGGAVAGRPWSPPTATLVADFARYHVVVAVLGAVVAVLLCVAAFRLWRARRSVTRQHPGVTRPVRLVGALALLAVAAGWALVAAANVGTALDPAPALLGFLQGGA